MSTYTAILDTQLDPDAPLTSLLMYQMRDNFLASAEGDTSVPLAVQLGHRLLGTIATTSGTTVTLSGLDLTKFRFLKLVFNNTGTTINTTTQSVGGSQVVALPSSGDRARGVVEIDLFNGIGFSCVGVAGATSSFYNFTSSITTASTSVSVTSSSNFSTGSIRVYGVQ
jgi:hypothetical protein